eukprot:CAMPEP_0194598518 /NCGR_PEP_ID=MMETSP0292-20121207/27054_1 /TAXON_ID=39354 /ORGANISM="Heterosigma akashiwo, Strain CCMP2393" /LENGTH=48 /DNA_ID= /DNA_START= /DNA_END= /DNA_ORIENTATION=
MYSAGESKQIQQSPVLGGADALKFDDLVGGVGGQDGGVKMPTTSLRIL